MKRLIATIAMLGAPAAWAAPANPDCPANGLTDIEQALVVVADSVETVKPYHVDAQKLYERELKACARAHGWTETETTRIDLLNRWTMAAKTDQPAVVKAGLSPLQIKAAVESLPQSTLGLRTWTLRKDALFNVLNPAFAARGLSMALVRSDPRVSAYVVALAHVRQERIRLTIEPTRIETAAIEPPPMAPAPERKPAPTADYHPVVTPPVAPVIRPAQPPAPVEVKAVPPRNVAPTSEIIAQLTPFDCPYAAIPAQARPGFGAYDGSTATEPFLIQATFQLQAALTRCAGQYGWDDATQAAVKAYAIALTKRDHYRAAAPRIQAMASMWDQNIHDMTDDDIAIAESRAGPGHSVAWDSFYGIWVLDTGGDNARQLQIANYFQAMAAIERFNRSRRP